MVNANVLPASWYKSDLLALLVALPLPRVNTIPKSVAVPVLPSPILITSSYLGEISSEGDSTVSGCGVQEIEFFGYLAKWKTY